MNGRLDLLIVNPGARTQVYGDLGSSLAGIEPPMWCALTAGYIRQHGYTVDILDAEVENLGPEAAAARIAEINPVLAAVIVLGSNPSASSTPKMTAAGAMMRSIRDQPKEVTTIIGGLHPSALPERTLRDEAVNYLAQGEGFTTILGLLAALKAGAAVKTEEIPGLWELRDERPVNGPPAPLVDPDTLPMAAWDLLDMSRYRAHNWHCFDHIDRRSPYVIMYTSLGCPFNCSYCNIHALYNNKPGLRLRSAESVVAEIDYLVKNYGMENIKFMDELFAVNEERVNNLCDAIIERGYKLNIWAYARVDTVSEKMMTKMKRAGINWLAYGFESASNAVRKGVAKKTEEETTRRAIEMTQAAGIYIMGNFIFGLPDDTLATMRETLDMAKDYNFEYVNFYTAMAYPGSQLYEEAMRNATRLPADWYAYGQFSADLVPLPTNYLSAEDVLRFRDEAFIEYFNNPAYLEMIGRKFGPAVVDHVKGMLKHRLYRKILDPSAA